MHVHNIDRWTHDHRFDLDAARGERNTLRVIALTIVMMVIEIFAGALFGSMALIADGWHMGTHAAALCITVFAYRYARRHAENPIYSFGTGKVGALGGFASAVVLGVVALLMVFESVQRFFEPLAIRLDEAIFVAVLGLIVNLVSAYILQSGGDGHDHGHGHAHRHDHNLRAAYLHVVADALTSFLAIFALFAGKLLGWVWMDPAMGIVGAIVITRWSVGLLRDSSSVLLDSDVPEEMLAQVRTAIESDADNRVTDLHLWRVGAGQISAIVSLVTHYPKPPEHYKELLTAFEELAHVTVEVNEGPGEPCLPS